MAARPSDCSLHETEVGGYSMQDAALDRLRRRSGCKMTDAPWVGHVRANDILVGSADDALSARDGASTITCQRQGTDTKNAASDGVVRRNQQSRAVRPSTTQTASLSSLSAAAASGLPSRLEPAGGLFISYRASRSRAGGAGWSMRSRFFLARLVSDDTSSNSNIQRTGGRRE